MATHAPPQTPGDLLGEDAFAAVARKLDALLDARDAREAEETRETEIDAYDTEDSAVAPVAPAQLVDTPTPLRPNTATAERDTNGGTNAAAELLSLLQSQQDREPADESASQDAGEAEVEAEPRPETTSHVQAKAEADDARSTLDVADTRGSSDIDESLVAGLTTETPPDQEAEPFTGSDAEGQAEVASEADPGASTHTEQESAIAEIDALLSQPPSTADAVDVAEQSDDGSAEESAQAPATAAPSAAAPVATAPRDADLDIPHNPSSNDLDAELEALLAESPIDPEVLNAADAMAKQDAEEAERNQEALRLRAEQAASALAGTVRGVADEEADDADITAEINGLLAAETAPDPADTDDTTPAEDPTIDQIDQMLAQGIDDEDDTLDGAFYSAQDVATDNLSGPGETLPEDAELPHAFNRIDSPTADPADPAEAESQTNEAPDKLTLREKIRRYGKPALRIAGELTLQGCWLLNWPARKFLTTQWRATLGYIALLQAAGALAVWLYLVVL